MSIMDEEGYGGWAAGLPIAPAPKPKPKPTVADEEGYGANPVIGDNPLEPTPPQSDDEIPKTVAEFIAKYGTQAAIVFAVPELRYLLDQAVKGKWTKDRFVAEFQQTDWYKTHGSVWRTAETAKATDPGEWAAAKKKTIERIKRRAIQIGLTISDADAETVADGLLHEYWGSTAPDDVLSQRIVTAANMSKITGGTTMSTRDSLKALAASMGVKFDEGWFENAAKSVAAGDSTQEQWQSAIKDAAKSRFPMFADQIDAGQTVEYIVSPYKQTLSSVLELPYTSIGLDDPSLVQAFGSVNKDGKPSVMGLWDFEKSLRNDPRWAYTKNARTQLDSVGRKVLQDFGLAY